MLIREMYTEEEMLEKLKNLKPGEILFHKGHKPVPKVPGKSTVVKGPFCPDVKPDGDFTREDIREAWREIFARQTPKERAKLAKFAAMLRGE